MQAICKWEPLCTYSAYHICVFEINHAHLREDFAFKGLSLILYHKVNIPESSFTFPDEWECPHRLVSPSVWDIPSVDKKLIRTFFILQQNVISRSWCENSCFMSDLHSVFQQPYSDAVCIFFLPFRPQWMNGGNTLTHTDKNHKQPSAPVV